MLGSKVRYSQCQFLESQIRGVTLTIDGVPLHEVFMSWQLEDARDRQVTVGAQLRKRFEAKASVSVQAAYDVIVAIAIVWNQLLQERGAPSLVTVSRRWCNSIEAIGFDRVLKCLKAADDLFLHIISEGEIYSWSYPRFKGALKAEYPGVGGVIAPIAPLLSACFTGDGATGIIRDVRQALSLTRKVWVPLMRPSFIDDCERAFIDTDTSLESNPPSAELLEFFELHFSTPVRYVPEYFHHGNGATYGVGRGKSFEYKEMDMVCDDLWFTAASILSWPIPTLLRHGTVEQTRVARFTAVPKACDKARGIDLEPTLLQWTQHGIAGCVWDYIRNDAYLSRRISKSEGKEINAKLALRGSVDGSFATIDSSSASDTVSLSLYLKCLRCNPTLRLGLLAGRSRWVELSKSGARVQLKKLAPMGNGYTFVMECIMFAAIVEEAIKLCGGDPRYSKYHIVGDDIIVEAYYAEKVMERLAYYGFKPNPDKSYWKQKTVWNFRESCGMEALDGEDITPFRLPRNNFAGLGNSQWSKKEFCDYLRIESLAGQSPLPVSLIALANGSYNGISDLRLFIVKNLLKLPKALSVRFDTTGMRGLLTDELTCTNYQLVSKYKMINGSRYKQTTYGVPKVHRDKVFWDRRAQCTTRFLGMPASRYMMSKYLGVFRLREWLRLAEVRERSSDVDSEARVMTAVTGLAVQRRVDQLARCDMYIEIPEAGITTHVSWESTHEMSTQCYPI